MTPQLLSAQQEISVLPSRQGNAKTCSGLGVLKAAAGPECERKDKAELPMFVTDCILQVLRTWIVMDMGLWSQMQRYERMEATTAVYRSFFGMKIVVLHARGALATTVSAFLQQTTLHVTPQRVPFPPALRPRQRRPETFPSRDAVTNYARGVQAFLLLCLMCK